MQKEFAIWGRSPGATQEVLLLAMPGGNPITCPDKARRYAETLRIDHGCTSIRIQEIDLSQPFDFVSVAMGRQA